MPPTPAPHEFPPWIIPLIGVLVSLAGTLLVAFGRSVLSGIRKDTTDQAKRSDEIKKQLDGIESEFGRRLERFETAISLIGKDVAVHGAAIEGLVATLADLKGSLSRVESSLQEVMSQVGEHATSLAEGGVLFRELRERLEAVERKLASVAEKGCAQIRAHWPAARPPDDSAQ